MQVPPHAQLLVRCLASTAASAAALQTSRALGAAIDHFISFKPCRPARSHRWSPTPTSRACWVTGANALPQRVVEDVFRPLLGRTLNHPHLARAIGSLAAWYNDRKMAGEVPAPLSSWGHPPSSKHSGLNRLVFLLVVLKAQAWCLLLWCAAPLHPTLVTASASSQRSKLHAV